VATSLNEVLRRLRVAFTAQELELLQTHKRFERALRECRGSREETQQLIAMGGALLAERNREKSKLPRG
jgi:hypothetical protein